MKKKFILLIVLLIPFISTNVLAKEQFKSCEYSDEYKNWLKLSEKEKQIYIMPRVCKNNDFKYNTILPNYSISTFSSEVEKNYIPSYFDLRNVNGTNYVTSIKNQKQTGTCTSHAALSTIETNVLFENPDLLENKDNYDLSELHVSYYEAYNYFSDGVNIEGNTNRVAGGGLSVSGVSSYLTKLRGPIYESEFPFELYYDASIGKEFNYNVKKISLEEIKNKNTIFDVNNIEWYFFDSCTAETLNKIKSIILGNGALQVSYYDSPEYLLNDKYIYANSSNLTNHSVSIIGWDDSISKTNFKLSDGTEPNKDGAFIIKNSWGTDKCYDLESGLIDAKQSLVDAYEDDIYQSLDDIPEELAMGFLESLGYVININENTMCKLNERDGYYYISYEDANVCKNLYLYSDIDFDIEDNVYFYDQLGYRESVGLGENIIYAANHFKKKNSNKELLKEVTIATTGNTDYEIYISYDKNEDGSPNLNNKELIGSGNIDHEGYGTHKFEEPILIDEDFSIIVRYETDTKYPLAIQISSASGYENTTLEANQSFVSEDANSWTDLSTFSSVSIPSIKAYTNNIDYDFAIGEVIKNDVKKDKFKIPITLTNITNQSDKDFSIKVLNSNEVDVTDEFTINNYIKANNYVVIEKKSLDTENGEYKVEISYDLLTYDTTIEITNSNPTIELGLMSFKSSNIYIDDNKIYDLYGGTLTIPVSIYNLDNNELSVEVTDMNGKKQDFNVQLNPIINNETSIQVTIPKNTQNGGYTVKVSSGDVNNQISFKIYDFVEVEDIIFKYDDDEIEEIILLKDDSIIVEGIISNDSTLTNIEYSIENLTDKQVVSLISNNEIYGNDTGTVNLVANIGDQKFKIPISVIDVPNITYNNITYKSNVDGNNKIDNYFGGKIELQSNVSNVKDNMLHIDYIITPDGMYMSEECLSPSRENNILKISISDVCIIQNGGGLTADTYKFVEKIGVFDTKQTIKEFGFDFKIEEYIPLESITSNIEKINLKIDETYHISNYEELTFTPSNATNKNIKYVGYDEEIIDINDDGTLTALKAGLTTIKVMSVYNEEIYDTVNVMVNPNIKAIETNIESNYNNKLYYGYGGKVTANITTENIIDNERLTIKYYKDDVEQNDMTNIFDTTNKTISNNETSIDLYVGKSLEIGKYKIELSYENAESKSFEFEVIEPIKVTSIEAEDIIISNDGSLTNINYQVNPSDAFNQKVEFKVADTSIAKVEDGKIKALKVGNTTLTIKALDGSNISKTVNVSVVEKSIVIDNIKLEKDMIYETFGGKLSFRISLINIDSTKVNLQIIGEDNNVVYNEEVTLNEKGYKDIEYSISKELKAGKYTIKVTDGNFEKTATFEVSSYKPVENLKFMYKEKELNNLILLNNKKINITSIITNNDSTFKDVSYSIKDTTIATITGEGLITGIKVGKTELIANVGFQTFKLPIEIIETNPIVSQSIYQSNISNEFVDVKYGGTITNAISFTNMNENSELNVEVYDGSKLLGMDYVEKNVFLVNYIAATISLNIISDKFNNPDKYTPAKELTVKYTYTLNDIDNTEVTKEYKVNLSEYNPITKINLSKTDIKLDVNESIDISSLINFEPTYATFKDIVYENFNGNIISLNRGIIKGVSEGTTTLTITSLENENVKTTINITVERNDYLEFSNKVNIHNESGSKYLKGFNANNTYKDLMNNIDTNLNVELKESNGTKVTNNSSVLKTGMKLSIGDNTYDIVIKGDMSGDGKMSITDLSQMRYHLAQAKGKIKTGAYKQAGDMNDKDGVTITDLSQMRKKLAGGN